MPSAHFGFRSRGIYPPVLEPSVGVVDLIGKISLWLGIILLLLANLSSDAAVQSQTVTFWHPYSGERQQVLDEMLAEYNAQNESGIMVEAASQDNDALLYDRVIINLLAEDRNLLPNIILVPPDTAALFSLSGRLVDLNNFAPNPDMLDEAGLTGVSPIDGARYGIPERLFTEVMLVNEDALAELEANVPTTIEDFIALSCTFRENSGWSGGKFGTVWGASLPQTAAFVNALAVVQGIEVFDGEQFNYVGLDQTLSLLAAGKNDGCLTTTDNRAVALEEFASGRALFFFASTSELDIVQRGIESFFVDSFEWGVYPLPGPVTQPYLYGNVLSIIDEDEALDAAVWDFIEWFMQPEQNARWAAATQSHPISQPAADLMAFAPQWQQVWDLMNGEAMIDPMLAGGEVIDFEVGAMWRRVLLSNTNPTDELANLELRVNQILADFGY
ncbi:MAG: extracellular solute-binding protein [Chloroflexi bacterium]|nr:extracellular solute-binding protein [Chloroflexota bacterium]